MRKMIRPPTPAIGTSSLVVMSLALVLGGTSRATANSEHTAGNETHRLRSRSRPETKPSYVVG